MLLAPKGDGSLRFCIDYHRVNEATRRDSCPVPCMEDCVDSLGETKYFSTLDANVVYWPIKMEPGDIPKTALTSHRGQWKYVRMPFGLKNARRRFSEPCI